MARSQPAQRLGELLVARGAITHEQLEQALAHQRTTGEFLGAVLVRIGTVTAETLLEAVSEQFGIPVEPLDRTRVDWTAPGHFSPSLFAKGNCFPIQADARSVTMAITNPLDVDALGAIERAAGTRQVRLVLVLERELRDVLQTYRRQLLQASVARLNGRGDEKAQ